MLKLVVHKTELFMDRLEAEPKHKLLNLLFLKLKQFNDDQFRLTGLKCLYTLLRKNKLEERQRLFELVDEIRTTNPHVNLHLLKILSELTAEVPAQQLIELYMPTVGGFMLRTTNKTEFDFADALYQWMLGRLR